MRSDALQPGRTRRSIGGEDIPCTMQGQASQMTIEDAVASGLFDVADEPGMVRIPISVDVIIPDHLLGPPGGGS